MAVWTISLTKYQEELICRMLDIEEILDDSDMEDAIRTLIEQVG